MNPVIATNYHSAIVTSSMNNSAIALQSTDGARVSIHRHGAHVTSWLTPNDDERLFLSPRAEFAPGKAIRGGVPIIFPQFDREGSLPRHGFARTSEWDVIDVADGEARLRLHITDEMRAVWPHEYVAEYHVRVGDDELELMLDVTNNGDTPITFTCALHTYLRLNDVREVRVDGLGGLRVADKIAGATRVEDADVITITGETDRIYFDALGSVVVAEPGRSMWIKQTGFTDVVVWNPWTSAAKLADMEPDGYLNMLCVESASIGKPIALKPREQWRGTQLLRAE